MWVSSSGFWLCNKCSLSRLLPRLHGRTVLFQFGSRGFAGQDCFHLMLGTSRVISICGYGPFYVLVIVCRTRRMVCHQLITQQYSTQLLYCSGSLSCRTVYLFLISAVQGLLLGCRDSLKSLFRSLQRLWLAARADLWQSPLTHGLWWSRFPWVAIFLYLGELGLWVLLRGGIASWFHLLYERF